MRINWKVRAKNKFFWLALIPAILIVVQVIADMFGYEIAIDVFGEKAALVVNSVFSLLVVLGIVVDPVVEGFGDSDEALDYEEPKKKGLK